MYYLVHKKIFCVIKVLHRIFLFLLFNKHFSRVDYLLSGYDFLLIFLIIFEFFEFIK